MGLSARGWRRWRGTNVSETESTFEEAVARLEEIVAALEAGTLSLDDSMAQFETAVALSRQCTARLERAERQISLLTSEEGLRPAAGLEWAQPADAGPGGGIPDSA